MSIRLTLLAFTAIAPVAFVIPASAAMLDTGTSLSAATKMSSPWSTGTGIVYRHGADDHNDDADDNDDNDDNNDNNDDNGADD
jgi:LDH2 family malate/lactate/ureidoglycolate dehydrogenase